MKGILLINKAQNMTSHDVVNIVRKKLNIKRVGHTGTLDPMVTGVLPICVGNATRVSEYIMQQGKKYSCTMKFGESTTTYDSYGETVNTSDKILFSKEEILETFEHFTGEISQQPPIFSAVKIKGKKLYSYARAGESIDIPTRKVTIYSLELISINDDSVSFNIHCSKGTYVRSLVHDIGLHLNTYAYMDSLIRTDVGNFNINDSIPIETFKLLEIEDIEKKLRKVEDSLYNLAKIRVDDDIISRLINGQKINLNSVTYDLEKNHNNCIDYDNIIVLVKGIFIGIGKIKDNILKMERVLN